jgi:hypothetical protein
MSMTGDYSNRSDLRNAATRRVAFTGQTYGQGAAQQRAQAAVPPGSAPQEVQAQQMAARPRPGARQLGRPSERPQEPITAGANFGVGPNAREAGVRPRLIPMNPVVEQLRMLYSMYPTDDLAALLARYTDGNF